MSLTNHMLTGAMLAKFLPLPLAIPLAFLSHFVLDSLPHFGYRGDDWTKWRRQLWIGFTVADIILAGLLSTWLLRTGHLTWFLVGVVAWAPDMAWVYRFSINKKFTQQSLTEGNRLTRFHRGIQREQPWGGIVEALYALGIVLVVH